MYIESPSLFYGLVDPPPAHSLNKSRRELSIGLCQALMAANVAIFESAPSVRQLGGIHFAQAVHQCIIQ